VSRKLAQGLFLEFSDPEDWGDEFGAIVLFVVLIIVLVWQYIVSSPAAIERWPQGCIRHRLPAPPDCPQTD